MMPRMLKFMLHKLSGSFRTFRRLNWLMTIYVNFRLLPFSQAIVFPIFCYGKIKTHCLKGKFILDGPVRNGMIKIGYRWFDLWPVSYLPTQLFIQGKVIFKGDIIISGGAALFAQSKVSEITFGKSVAIGGATMIKCINSIVIGERTRVTGFCTIMDSNMHFVKNVSNGKIARRTGSILIGEHCWINYGAVITKGAVVPSYSIVARGGFVGKSFKDEGTNLFLAGTPVKIINKNVQRIFDYTREGEIRDYFIKHPECDFYQDEVGIKDESQPFNIE